MHLCLVIMYMYKESNIIYGNKYAWQCMSVYWNIFYLGGVHPVEAEHATEEEACPYGVSGVQSRFLCHSNSSTETI